MTTVMTDGLSFMLPLFIMAIAGIYCERSGVTMLAVEGLQGVGAFVGALAAVCIQNSFSSDSMIPFFVAVIGAMIGGAAFSLIHVMLCLKFKANQVISGVVVNILASSLTAYLTKLLNRVAFGATSDKFVLNVSKRFSIPGLCDIPVIGGLFTNMYLYEILIVAAAVIAWFVLYKTRFGLHLRACGDNPQAVDACGGNVLSIQKKAIMICGALSGFGGICFAYSISANFSSNIYSGYGYLAIAGLIFGNWRIVPTLAACALFSFARSAGYYIVQLLELPSSYQDLIMILPYVLTLLLLIFFSRHNGSPRALGQPYDKGQR